MGYMLRVSFAVFLLAGFAIPASARPVSYPDGWMLMSMNNASENSLMLSYSPTAKDAFGVRSDYRRDEKYWLHTAIYNRLLQRWNRPNSQANIFLQAGAGFGKKGSRAEPAASIGLEADWETRRFYLSYENRFIAAGSIERDFTHKARFGVAPYVAGYNGLHSWLMVQIEHQPDKSHSVTVTPLVRVFTTDVLGEIGISSKSDVMINLTLQF